MCDLFDAPEAPKIEEPEPEVLTNPFDRRNQDERQADSARRGTSSLRIPLDTGLGVGFAGRGGSASAGRAGTPKANSRPSTGLSLSPGASSGAAARPNNGTGLRL